ncbi:MAG: methylated-DNA--[protein]-cysteine S-methyltransferase [Alphaproteobacteria bacterium]|nr:methylated-DNA--[protein]-cysteine S-methyltransferase [Alphaproteobacteria bacterium]
MKLRFGAVPPKCVTWTLSKCVAGSLVVGVTDKGEICRAAFLRGRDMKGILKEWEKEWPKTDYVRNAKLEVDPEAPRYLVGTEFQQAVWREIAAIPKGQTRTYGEIAKRLGNPKAVRAVGSACGANPVPYFVPCHRVVGLTGLGGFSGGVNIKKLLLNSESKALN